MKALIYSRMTEMTEGLAKLWLGLHDRILKITAITYNDEKTNRRNATYLCKKWRLLEHVN